SDTYNNEYLLKAHYRSIKKSAKDTVYVCNSPAAHADLASISGEAAKRAVVIPYFIPPMKRVDVGFSALHAIAESRLAKATVPKSNASSLQRWFNTDKIPPFIMSVATIEPRKNFIRLIDAWQLMRSNTKRDVKLLIVGTPGWEFEETISHMKPYVEK